MAENLISIARGQSILNPPLFDGTNYTEWKEHMKIFIQSLDFKLWFIIKNGLNIPKRLENGIEVEKSEDEFDDEDLKSVQQDSRAKHILLCAVNSEVYKGLLNYKTAKQIWDALENRERIDNVNSSTPHTNHMKPKSNQYNCPSLDFIDESGNAKNNYFFALCVPLYKHALEGNWEEAKIIINKDQRLKNAAIASGLPTVLHIAAGACGGAKHVHFVQQLMQEFLSDADLLLQDYNGNTAFCFAAAAGNIEIVKLMQNKNPRVVWARGVKGATPIQFAALQGRCEMAWHLYDITKPKFTRDDEKQLFFTCINTGLYGLALEMATENSELAFERDYENDETALHLLAKNHLDSCCQSPHHQSHTIMINPGMKQQVVYQLVKKLWRTICGKYTRREIIEFISEPSQLIFAAAEVGNFGFLSEVISDYPSLVWETDEKEEQTIIHKAVKYRHASIYNVIHEIGSQKDIVVTMTDTSGNTLLHLAAKLAPPSRLELVSGAAFQMCLELVWFKEVKKIMLPSLIKSTNSEGLTASELFTKEHTQLRKDAESWMKSTAENCMLIATVIATGVFTAAISLPGGVDGNKGKPNYLNITPAFLVFAISDAIAFISSAAAILIFLSILVSRYAEYDFYKSLPLKLIFGLVTLFCSITSMMVAVASAFFITYYYDSNWLPGFISVFAFLPILLFIILQFSLWSEIMYSTFYCKNIFKPDRKLLYSILKEMSK